MTRAARRPAPLSSTGIGSLPHTQLELALQQAFLADVPYLPELPRRSPAESLTAQALELLPGLQVFDSGRVAVDPEAWERGSFALETRLEAALDDGVVEPFLPADRASAWNPFLWEVESRKAPFAKVQCLGPATALTALTCRSPLPERLREQVVRLVHLRALAMARAIRVAGAVPVVFLDEPCIGAVRRAKAADQAKELELLRASIVGLRNEGAITGLHCCGEADWAPLLALGLDVLSFDATLSLEKVLVARPDVERFLEAGGWFALGIVPTDTEDPAAAERRTDASIRLLEGLPAGLRSRLLSQSLLTPACGLGMRSVRFSEQVLWSLAQAQGRLRALAAR